jgi:hypothetical protein
MGFKWGQVASVSPLTVRLDGSSTAVPVVRSLVGALTVGDMVRVELSEGKVVVYGLPGGSGYDDSVLSGRVGVNEGDIADLQNSIEIAIAAGTKWNLVSAKNKVVIRNGVATIYFKATSKASISAFDTIVTFDSVYGLPSGETMMFSIYNTASGATYTPVRLAGGQIQFVGSLPSGTPVAGSVTWVIP